MRFEEYRKHDAISLAGLIAKREVSVEDVLETAITRAEQVNPTINAIVHRSVAGVGTRTHRSAAVSDQQFRHEVLFLEQLAHEPQGRSSVASALRHVENLALVI